MLETAMDESLVVILVLLHCHVSTHVGDSYG